MPVVSLPLTHPTTRPAPPRPALLHLWWRRACDRRVYAALTPAQMRDTGLDPDVVRQESRKRFWQA
ncbi:translation initiation factor IF-2 [Methylobacterium terricola]|uniref:Translation initiation factor IF-2 n=1 Tax=Methylobacterium terricola TaxID=2583531 RepID=A0A5C4LN21_9HYPH|nr:translation initiation factor IF-2 [Methylobacterium terricola]TNC14109.1 translation initiation factor IF-2 [Methylobacterium terricola]